MLARAMDAFQVAKAAYIEKKKAQYTDKKQKDYFRASELGMLRKNKRKLIYGFFGHHFGIQTKSAHNLRQLENGDYVHDRYQTNWKLMGILVLKGKRQSMEIRVSSKDDPWLSQFPWVAEGHYDGELDLNLVRAYALGKVRVDVINRNGQWVMEPVLDFEYGKQIGYFNEDGTWNQNYKPVSMVADIKTMNPYQFKSVKEGNLSSIEGYLDQISFYMYMLDTPYGCIFIENKANNELLEVQIVWTDLRGGQYDFDDNLHGAEGEDPRVIRAYIDNQRFEALVHEIDATWQLVNKLKEADAMGDYAAVANLLPSRCSFNPDSFPCKWSTGQCEFYDHCWSQKHSGNMVRPEPSSEDIWEIDGMKIDCRRVPEGVTKENFKEWLAETGEDWFRYAAPDFEKIREQDPFEYDEETGEIIGRKKVPEYLTTDGERAFKCIRCTSEVTYKRLMGGVKKCPHCGQMNHVAV